MTKHQYYNLVNTAEWSEIPESRQRKLIANWCEAGEIAVYESMALKAANSLKEQLTHVPTVSNVEVGAEEIISTRAVFPCRFLVLVVYTPLVGSKKIDAVPLRFHGFKVRQVNLGEKRAAFLNTWMKLFQELRGWTERQTLQWAAQWDDALTGRISSAIYHYGPVKTAVPALLDAYSVKLKGTDLLQVCNEVTEIIEQPQGDPNGRVEHPDLVENFDWNTVRKRVEKNIELHRQNPSSRVADSN